MASPTPPPCQTPTPRNCRVCRDQRAAAIEIDVRAGVLSVQALADKYAIPPTTIRDHAAKCLGVAKWPKKPHANIIDGRNTGCAPPPMAAASYILPKPIAACGPATFADAEALVAIAVGLARDAGDIRAILSAADLTAKIARYRAADAAANPPAKSIAAPQAAPVTVAEVLKLAREISGV